MRVSEIDLQSIALIKLRGKLDMESVQIITKKVQNFLDKNRFKVIIDMGKVQVDDISLISLSIFLNEFKQQNGNIKIIPSTRGGIVKIELHKIPGGNPIVVQNTKFH
jgi:anti-anti-sigma regulatory factor